VIKRINRHAQKHFAGKYTHLDIEFIWGVCYIDAYNDPAVRTEERYELTILPTGRLVGTPELTFHTAAERYLNDSQWLSAS
jgi:hypothetical protein